MRPLVAALLVAAGLVVPGSIRASSAAALYNRGNQLYQAGRYEEAREAYEKALSTGVMSAELYYNLGNAELRGGRLGPAVVSYLRAKRIKPRDPDIRFNLDYARAKIKARLPELPRGPVSRALDLAVEYLSANEWTAVVVIAYWLIAASAIGLIASRSPPLRRASRVLIYTGIAVLVLAAPLTSVRVKRDLGLARAVILSDKVTARSGPGEDNAALFDLYEGMEVVVGQCESGWCRVSASGGFIGWSPAQSFERL